MRFIEKASKSVQDADGFYTDYTMYFDTEINWYVFVFGDKDIYLPENSDFDWTCETEEEALEWFDSYNGFEDYERDDYGNEEPWDYEERNYQRLSDDGYNDDSDRGCKDCPPDECTGHCMSCYYRPV